MATHEILIDGVKCVGCGLCADVCAENNIVIKNGKAEVIDKNCLMCGHCTAVCPKYAVTASGYDTPPLPDNHARLNPAEVLEVIRFRRSIRKFNDKKIPDEVVKQIIEAGRLTHTAKNLQDVEYIVLDKEKARFEKMAVKLFKKLKPLANLFSAAARRTNIDDNFFFFGAPSVIVIIAKELTNGVLASQNMEFIAEANGLGVLYSGFFAAAANASRKIKKNLNIPRGKKVAAVLVLGYPKIKYLRSAQRETAKVKYM